MIKAAAGGEVEDKIANPAMLEELLNISTSGKGCF